MKANLEFEAQVQLLQDWLNGKEKSLQMRDMKAPVYALLWAWREVRERNEILTKVLVEAAARAVDLRPIATASEPTKQTPASVLAPIPANPQPIEQVPHPHSRGAEETP
jgi:hypothetical protein